MPQPDNFSYQASPMEDIGGALATAIFGNPEAAAAQRKAQAEAELRAAQTSQAQAHGGLYTEQARGVRGQNDAGAGLPELFRTWAASQVPQQPQTTASPGFADFDTPMPEQAPAPDKTAALASLMAAMGQMNGDKIDPTKMMGAFGAFGGGDEMARRGMVAQGNTPGENFALTPQRADEIAANDAQAKQASAFGVARINHASDIPTANIQAGASRYGADRRLDAAHYGADSRAQVRARSDPQKRPVRLVGVAATRELTDQIKKFEAEHRVSLSATTRATILSKAISVFQQTGNFADAITQATARLSVAGQDARDRDATGEGPPVHGARKAADGNWYVQSSQNADGTPAYSRVGGTAANWRLPQVTNW